jgi:methylglyoxal synthase
MPGDRSPTIALVASRSLRRGPTSPLLTLVRALEPWFRHVLRPHILALEGSYRSLRRYGVLDGYAGLETLPCGAQGGLVSLAARLVDPDPARAVDWVIYLMDPADPTTLYPETQAVKRECVVNAKPFLATAAAALEWCVLNWLADDIASPHEVTRQFLRPRAQHSPSFANGIGLIAHDARKLEMVQFAADHAALLSRFPVRLATGTTGGLLNGTVPARLQQGADVLAREAAACARLGFTRPAVSRQLQNHERLCSATDALQSGLDGLGMARPWVTALRSGPQGGDGQIAEAVLAGRCGRVIFFEDPHVSRQHEADILLLERAARIDTDTTLCLHDPTTARRWATAWTVCLGHSTLAPVTLDMAFRQRFGCTLIVANDDVQTTLRRYSAGLIGDDGNALPVAFAGDVPSAGGVAILSAGDAADMLDAT